MSIEQKPTDWNEYAAPFQSVMPSEMVRLNREAAGKLYGNVADFGCGAGKIIPFVLAEKAVNRYIGIDMSSNMARGAQWMAAQFSSAHFPHKPCDIIEARIETVCIRPVDSAVSINSYYTWPDPVAVLKHIVEQMKDNALFVLATINPSLNIPALLDEAEKEQIANPYWEAFKRHNLEIYNSKNYNLVTMDELVDQVCEVGLKVMQAHTVFYAGGLNFLVLKKRKAR